MARRKTIAMLIAVTVPAEMSVAQAKKEVRSRIDDECGYFDTIHSKDRYGDSTLVCVDEAGGVKLRKIGWAKSLGLGVKRLVLGAAHREGSKSLVSF